VIGDRQQNGRDGILVPDHEESSDLVAPEEKPPKRHFIDGEAQGEDARSVAAEERLDLAVETLGAIASQHEESRDSTAASHAGLVIAMRQPLLLVGEHALGSLQAAHDPAS
jgi:hypothetical protein